MADVLPRAAFRTVAGEPIGDAFETHFGGSYVPINNVFPRQEMGPARMTSADEPLRLYWFSQTVGYGRGLDELVDAIAVAGIRATLTLRGNGAESYAIGLEHDAEEVGADLTIVPHPPGAPDAMVRLCQEHDVGLALEQTAVPNRDICLTNKLFAFIAAGLPIIGTATTAQRPILQALGPGAGLVTTTAERPYDTVRENELHARNSRVESLAAALRHWNEDRQALAEAATCVANAAHTRWHWEHELERGRLVDTVERALG